jgi:hypothetical protein
LIAFTIQLTPEAKRNLANYIDKEYVVEFLPTAKLSKA